MYGPISGHVNEIFLKKECDRTHQKCGALFIISFFIPQSKFIAMLVCVTWKKKKKLLLIFLNILFIWCFFSISIFCQVKVIENTYVSVVRKWMMMLVYSKVGWFYELSTLNRVAILIFFSPTFFCKISATLNCILFDHTLHNVHQMIAKFKKSKSYSV